MGNQKMKIEILTCGKHIKGANAGNFMDIGYDGPLTSEAIEKFQKVMVPSFDQCFIGLMQRHRETAQALMDNHTPINSRNLIITADVGCDNAIFTLLKKRGGVQLIGENFLRFLQNQKGRFEKIFLITSRIYPLILGYCASGGEKRYGPLSEKFIETYLPSIESGAFSSFEI